MSRFLIMPLISLICFFQQTNCEEVKPNKKPTDEQRAKVKVGDYVIYAYSTKSVPQSNIDGEYHVKSSVTAVKDDTFTLVVEIVKGTPPKGTPRKSEYPGQQMANIPEIPDFYSNKKVGEKKKESKIGSTILRDTDKQIIISNSKLICKNFKITWDMTNGHASELLWLCPPEFPITVTLKTKTEFNLVVKGKAIKITQLEELVEFGRLK
jgi:hypothetical protein